MKVSYLEFDAVTRLHFSVFVQRVFAELNPGAAYHDNFHIQIVIAELEKVRAGDLNRLAFALPPRSLKSIIISVAYPAWLLGHDPGARIICVSYGQELADKMAHDCRQVMQSDWYRRLFPKTALAPKRQSLGAFETTAGGGRFSTSVGGVTTGFGGDYIIVDDPMKPEEALSDADRRRTNDWIQHTLFTRLNDKRKGAIIIVMQRLHEDDVIGNLLLKLGSGFNLIAFPAIAQEDEEHVVWTAFGSRLHHRAAGEALHPDREPLSVLEEQRRLLGTQHFAAQYLQMPSPPGGNLIKIDWFGRFDLSAPWLFDRYIQSWDTASRNTVGADYSVCATFGVRGKHVYLLHILRRKVEFPELKRLVRQQAELFSATTILIEECSSGIALIQDLRSEGLAGLRAHKPAKDKVSRMEVHTARLEAGYMLIPHSAPWLDDYEHELMMFPNGKFDDQVDATSQALDDLFGHTGPDAFLNLMRAKQAKELDRAIPTIRLNHPDLGHAFRVGERGFAPREADGSFLVTEEEYRPLKAVSGIYLMIEESPTARIAT